jgi:hypothetical protein
MVGDVEMHDCILKTEGKRLSARSGLDGVRHYVKWIVMVLCKKVRNGVGWLTKF